MKITVKVTANAKAPIVLKLNDSSYAVKVNAPAIEGKANERLVAILAEHFNTSKSKIRILSGLRSKNKVVEIATDS